jgi:hypothetical protein
MNAENQNQTSNLDELVKVNLVETPHTWDDIVKHCERASTPADAATAACMAWNFAVEMHHAWNAQCERVNADLKDSDEAQELDPLADFIYNTDEEQNDGC